MSVDKNIFIAIRPSYRYDIFIAKNIEYHSMRKILSCRARRLG
jgi:hypothetical protein